VRNQSVHGTMVQIDTQCRAVRKTTFGLLLKYVLHAKRETTMDRLKRHKDDSGDMASTTLDSVRRESQESSSQSDGMITIYFLTSFPLVIWTSE
jgi:hypothetical protein